MAPIGFLATPSKFSSLKRSVNLLSGFSRRTSHSLSPRMGLSVRSEPLPNCKLRLEISVCTEECTVEWDTVVKGLIKRSPMKGFRPGKVPKEVVINEYGKERILASACEEVIEMSISKAIKVGGVSAIGQAEVDKEGGVGSIIKDY